MKRLPVRILHLSDLHISEKRPWDSDPVLAGLVNDVAGLVSTAGPLDLAVVTGDIASFGKSEEYARAATWLTGPLANSAGLDARRIRVVPGNHDVDRGAIGRVAKAMARDLRSPTGEDGATRTVEAMQRLVGDVLDQPSERAPLLERQAAFLEFARRFHPGLDAPWWSETQEIRGWRVHLAGLNSAWLCASDADRGQLVLGRWQVNRLLAGADDADLAIALLHHPWDYLAEWDELSQEEVRRKCGVILSGHLHQQKARLAGDPDRDVLQLAAGAGYGGSSWANAYQVLELDPGRGEARVHFRVWDGHDWIPDRNRFQRAPGGVATLKLRTNTRTSPPPTGPKDGPYAGVVRLDEGGGVEPTKDAAVYAAKGHGVAHEPVVGLHPVGAAADRDRAPIGEGRADDVDAAPQDPHLVATRRSVAVGAPSSAPIVAHSRRVDEAEPAGEHRLPPTFRRYCSSELSFVVATWVAAALFAGLGALACHALVTNPTPSQMVVAAQLLVTLLLFTTYALFGRLPEGSEAPYLINEIRKVAWGIEAVPERRPWLRCSGSAIASFEQLRWGVLFLLGSWTLLYVVLVFKVFNEDCSSCGLALGAVATFLNNCASVAMFSVYVVMTFVTTSPVTPTAQGADNALWLILPPAIAVVLLFIGDLTMSLSLSYPYAHDLYAVAAGLGGSLALAMWVGRLDSKFIDANTGCLALFYAYAAIQPLWVVAEGAEVGAAQPLAQLGGFSLFAFALVVKVVLVQFILWLTASGRFLFYFARIRDLSEHILETWLHDSDRSSAPHSGTSQLSPAAISTVALIQIGLSLMVISLAWAFGAGPTEGSP